MLTVPFANRSTILREKTSNDLGKLSSIPIRMISLVYDKEND
jgi:hypothetical protein